MIFKKYLNEENNDTVQSTEHSCTVVIHPLFPLGAALWAMNLRAYRMHLAKCEGRMETAGDGEAISESIESAVRTRWRKNRK